MASIGALSILATVASTALSAVGTIAAGNAQKSAAIMQARQEQQYAEMTNKYQLEQAEMNREAAEAVAAQQVERGNTELAAAQREAEDRKRKRNFALSKMVAQSAGSGFIPGVGDLAYREDDLFGYGTRQASLATAEGVQKKRDYDFAAANTIYDAESQYWAAKTEGGLRTYAANAGLAQARGISMTPSYLSAAGTIAAGAGEGFEKYKKYYPAPPKPAVPSYG